MGEMIYPISVWIPIQHCVGVNPHWCVNPVIVVRGMYYNLFCVLCGNYSGNQIDVRERHPILIREKVQRGVFIVSASVL